ncbi:hypothetical protein SNEBB_008165 [Seison nebaliae]|nr:hypothetical protein SNEBB_008165 [Seison nebaliae]
MEAKFHFAERWMNKFHHIPIHLKDGIIRLHEELKLYHYASTQEFVKEFQIFHRIIIVKDKDHILLSENLSKQTKNRNLYRFTCPNLLSNGIPPYNSTLKIISLKFVTSNRGNNVAIVNEEYIYYKKKHYVSSGSSACVLLRYRMLFQDRTICLP